MRITHLIDVDLRKNDPSLWHLIEHVIGEFAAGRQTALEWEGLRPLAETHLADPAWAPSNTRTVPSTQPAVLLPKLLQEVVTFS